MGNNAGGLTVNYGSIDEAATMLADDAKKMDQVLSDLRQLVVKSTEYWTGEAQKTFGEKLGKWDREATDIHQALHHIGQIVQAAGGDYQGGDKKAASFFQ